MAVVEGDPTVPVIWDTYKEILTRHDPAVQVEYEERFDFYDRSKHSYAILITGKKRSTGILFSKKV